MKPKISGKIQFEHIPASRSLRKFVEKHINQWIQKRIQSCQKYIAKYRVDFSRAGTGHTFTCQIVIQFGSETWVGQNYQYGLHQTLIQCLSNQMSLMARPPQLLAASG